MLAPIALVVLLVGGMQTALIVTDDPAPEPGAGTPAASAAAVERSAQALTTARIGSQRQLPGNPFLD